MAKTPNQTSSYSISAKVTDGGQVSVYIGDRRFPVTLYRDHWDAILSKANDLQSFMRAPVNAAKLTTPQAASGKAKGATTL